MKKMKNVALIAHLHHVEMSATPNAKHMVRFVQNIVLKAASVPKDMQNYHYSVSVYQLMDHYVNLRDGKRE